ncbi:MAG: protein arginine kinase [Bacillota bacterium]
MSGDKTKPNLSRWIIDEGPERDVVLSSRIRLARNLAETPYPNRASGEERAKILNKVKNGAENWEDKLHYLQIDKLPEVERGLLVEKNLISPELVQQGSEKGLLLDDNESISIMINEEDHLRIQVLKSGLQLDEAWQKINNLDDFLEKNLNYAFSKRWGYLSACPTNLGTGLRASVMVHLPALAMTDNISKMLEAVSKLGLVVRGIYGEGSESVGNIYQISNQVSLGSSEEDIIDNLKSVTAQIIEYEKKSRENLMNNRRIELMDKIRRSYGTLKYAYKISSNEAMKILSSVKLGIDMGIIDDVNSGLLSKLIVLIRPAHLQKYVGKELSTVERDIKRAELIQKILSSEEE